jgi:hypothetical protein
MDPNGSMEITGHKGRFRKEGAPYVKKKRQRYS